MAKLGLSSSAPHTPRVGETWAYRVSDVDPSQRIKVLAVDERKRSIRVEVEYLDPPRTGEQENVPGQRLRVPWDQVEMFDQRMASEQRLQRDDVSEVESDAAGVVFEVLVPERVATISWSPIHHASLILDQPVLEVLMAASLDDVLTDIATMPTDKGLLVSPHGALVIAAYVCRHDPDPVLDYVMQEEAQIRDRCKSGRRIQDVHGKGFHSTPEFEWEWYLDREKPKHELIRQWAGFQQVTAHERLAAAEAEVRRLNTLLAEVIESVEDLDRPAWAQEFRRRHDQEQITPTRVRPIVDRPRKPEIRYIEVPRRRRWGS